MKMCLSVSLHHNYITYSYNNTYVLWLEDARISYDCDDRKYEAFVMIHAEFIYI